MPLNYQNGPNGNGRREILQEQIFKQLDVILEGLNALQKSTESLERAGINQQFDRQYLAQIPSYSKLITSYKEYLKNTPLKSQLLNLANHPPALSQVFAMVELLIYFNVDKTQSGDLLATYRELQTTIESLICLNGEGEPYEI